MIYESTKYEHWNGANVWGQFNLICFLRINSSYKANDDNDDNDDYSYNNSDHNINNL
jgi:hypothetical protein